MIRIDSKSYPYLAVAQHYHLDYGTLLLNDIDVIKQQQENWKEPARYHSVYAREIWNAAIEKAYYVATQCKCGAIDLEIKSLKINVDKGK